jgi:hypothetical protein
MSLLVTDWVDTLSTACSLLQTDIFAVYARCSHTSQSNSFILILQPQAVNIYETAAESN